MSYTCTPFASAWKIYLNRGPIIGVNGLNFIPPLLSSDPTYMCGFNGVMNSAISVLNILITCISPSPCFSDAKSASLVTVVGENEKSKVLPFNATSIAVQLALESLQVLKESKSLDTFQNLAFDSWEYTFSSVFGSPSIITVNDTYIKGNSVHIEVIRIAEGSTPAGGFLFLSFRGEKTRRLSVNSSIDELGSAIRSLRTVDDVVISLEKKITEIDKDRGLFNHFYIKQFPRKFRSTPTDRSS